MLKHALPRKLSSGAFFDEAKRSRGTSHTRIVRISRPATMRHLPQVAYVTRFTLYTILKIPILMNWWNLLPLFVANLPLRSLHDRLGACVLLWRAGNRKKSIDFKMCGKSTDLTTSPFFERYSDNQPARLARKLFIYSFVSTSLIATSYNKKSQTVS
jgi:hypothetical protein